ncbi:hypothetical protein EYF80_065582 [Liparis tanakae]|uniref:Uncharacterized protein n=1 Tax=Liparis tanakae TaxID=230148 RepID=A0A4Z2E694_9TELE|nr:hypothetical protein EYF80_065582 [Liparis tanakae]
MERHGSAPVWDLGPSMGKFIQPSNPNTAVFNKALGTHTPPSGAASITVEINWPGPSRSV